MSNPIPYKVRQLPVIGGLSSKLGQVIDIVSQPCAPTPTVMISAAWKNIPTLLFTLFKPDPFDAATDRFGEPHHRKRKWKFQVNDRMLGNVDRGTGPVSWAVFRGGQLAQRAGWYFLVADATLDFLVNWTSTAYQWSGCDVPGTPFAEAAGRDAPLRIIEGKDKGVAAFRDPIWQSPFFANEAYVQCPAGYDTTVSAQLTWTAAQGGAFPGGIISNVRLINLLDGSLGYQASIGVDNEGRNTAIAVHKGWYGIQTPQQWGFVIDVDKTGDFTFTGSHISMTGSKSPGILPDP